MSAAFLLVSNCTVPRPRVHAPCHTKHAVTQRVQRAKRLCVRSVDDDVCAACARSLLDVRADDCVDITLVRGWQLISFHCLGMRTDGFDVMDPVQTGFELGDSIATQSSMATSQLSSASANGTGNPLVSASFNGTGFDGPLRSMGLSYSLGFRLLYSGPVPTSIRLWGRPSFDVYGGPPELPAMDVVLHQGWNWIGHAPFSAYELAQVVVTSGGFSADDLIVTRVGDTVSFSVFDGSAFLGSLATLEQGRGYQVFVSHATTFTYAVASQRRASRRLQTTNLGCTARFVASANLSFMPVAAFVVPAVVVDTSDELPMGFPSDGTSAATTCDQLIAVGVSDGKVRGTSDYLSSGFTLAYLGTAGEEIEFRFWHAASQTEYYSRDRVTMMADGRLGNLSTPYVMRMTKVSAGAAGVTIAAAAGGGVGALLALCCLPLILLWLWRCRRRRSSKVGDAAETVASFVGEEAGSESKASEKLLMLQQILQRSMDKRVSLAQAANDMLSSKSMLPPALTIALDAEFWRRQRRNSGTASPTDADRLLLLQELLQPAGPPSGIVRQAREVFLQRTGRLAANNREALELLSKLLEPHIHTAPSPESDDLAYAVEEEVALMAGPHGGGGARIRPPKLRPPPDWFDERLDEAVESEGQLTAGSGAGGGARVRPPRLRPPHGQLELDRDLEDAIEDVAELGHDGTGTGAGAGMDGTSVGGGVRIRPPQLRPPPRPPSKVDAPGLSSPPTFNLDSVPLAALEASTAVFGNEAAKALRDDGQSHTVEQLSTLKQRLDNLLSHDTAISSAAPALNALPPEVLDAANKIFLARHGYPAGTDLEALACLRGALAEAGVRAPGQKSALEKVIEELPPPPPPAVNLEALPASVVNMAATVDDKGQGRLLEPEDVRAQRQLLGLQKKVADFMTMQNKVPRLVLTMARAEFEHKEGKSAKTDLEAVRHLIDVFSDAAISEVARGWDGGGGVQLRPPMLGPTAGKAATMPPPPPTVDIAQIPMSAVRAAAGLGTQVARMDIQDQVAVLRTRLQEYQRAVLPEQAMEDAHSAFMAENGRKASSDKEALQQLSGWVDKATTSDIRPGFNGGGGARVFPPRPRPVKPPSATGAAFDDDARPLQLGAVPLAVVDAAAVVARGRSSKRNLLSSVFDGGDAGVGADATKETLLIQRDSPETAAQLRRMQIRVEHALDANEFGELPRPVRDAARSIFIARKGRAPPSERESLQALRDVLEESGVRRHDLHEPSYQETLSGRAAVAPALPPGLAQLALELDGNGGGLHGAAGAADLGFASIYDDEPEEKQLGHTGGGHAVATALQLRKLKEQLDAYADEDATAPPVLPPEVVQALNSEFQTRFGGDDSADTSELCQLAKQVMSEVEQSRACKQIDVDQTKHASTTSGRASRHFDTRRELESTPPGRGWKALKKTESRKMIIGGFDFHQSSERDLEREAVRRFTQVGARASVQEGDAQQNRPRLLERSNTTELLHHVGSRHEQYVESVQSAVDALAADSSLQTSVRNSKDADDLMARLEPQTRSSHQWWSCWRKYFHAAHTPESRVAPAPPTATSAESPDTTTPKLLKEPSGRPEAMPVMPQPSAPVMPQPSAPALPERGEPSLAASPAKPIAASEPGPEREAPIIASRRVSMAMPTTGPAESSELPKVLHLSALSAGWHGGGGTRVLPLLLPLSQNSAHDRLTPRGASSFGAYDSEAPGHRIRRAGHLSCAAALLSTNDHSEQAPAPASEPAPATPGCGTDRTTTASPAAAPVRLSPRAADDSASGMAAPQRKAPVLTALERGQSSVKHMMPALDKTGSGSRSTWKSARNFE